MDNRIKTENIYDAIVIGSGISGGWAAMELCKKGLKTLLLERGRNVKHIIDYSTATLHPWQYKNGYYNTTTDVENEPVKSLVSNPAVSHFFVGDKEQPYIQEKPFNWFRGYQVGGRSLTWGRQCYRWSDLDFEANKKDGVGVDWPIRYKDLEKWYDYVESFVGVSGQSENLPQLPDGKFLPAMPLNCVENHLRDKIKPKGKVLTIARVANLSKGWNGRGPCLNRNMCNMGCPYGGYFSSNSATIPIAEQTGNLTLRPFSIVAEILYDERTEKAAGVLVIDGETGEKLIFRSKIIFINASTIATAAILLNSKSKRFPNGFGNDSEQLGRNLMDHHSSAGAYGTFDGFKDKYYKGRRPCGFLIPRYRNIKHNENLDFSRGYNIQGDGERQGWQDLQDEPGFGKDFKNKLTKPGSWTVWMAGWGECLPYPDNQVSLDAEKKDKWGLPIIKVNFSFKTNEENMMKDIQETCKEMLSDAGFTNVSSFNYRKPGGSTIHEMGTARMGNDPKTSVLNKFNQMHAVKNVFITDGSCMASSACQNPSLTYMALTARACDFAVNEIKNGNL
ncbi:GMC family oxidoreductase [Pedobacter aquatilis]|uniref:GMC family oxidoreductase n=1 Tax=Pedobacter aquatilis TaxID=351343 RepID=UPI00292E0CE3|nr:GMC family oxidoreductase [Pedobacter aquatilis]